MPHSAVQYVRGTLGLQVCAIARLTDLLDYLQQAGGDALGANYAQVQTYRDRYGVQD
jgi:orotate phosphoribosyltransferase